MALANYFVNGITPEDTINNHFNTKEIKVVKEYDYDNNTVKEYYKTYGLYDFCIGAKAKGENRTYERFLIQNPDDISEDVKESIVLGYGFEKVGKTYKADHTGFMSLDELFTELMVQNKYVLDRPLSKTTRYIISNNGVQLIKKLPPLARSFKTKTDLYREKVDASQMNIFDIIDDVKLEPEDRETNIESGFTCTVVNKIDDDVLNSAPDIINKNYYIQECYKIINKINEQ